MQTYPIAGTRNQQSITICCNSFPPEKGGAPNRIYNMALLLRDAGYKVTVITAMPNYPTGRIFPGYRWKLVQREQADEVEIIRLGLFPSNSRNVLLRGGSLISHLFSILVFAGPRLLFRKTDLVIVSSPPLVSAWLVALLAACGRKKLLVNISDLWPLTAVEMGAMGKGFFYNALKKMEAGLYRRAHTFTGQSIEIIDHIDALITVPMHGFLYRNLQSGSSPASCKNDSHGQVLNIIYAGNLGHAQGMKQLCNALNFTALGASLSVFGAGAEQEAIRILADKYPEKGIRVYPTLPAQQLNDLLGDYDAVLIPLKKPIHGAVPSKLFMAVNAGLPVLFCAGGEGEKLVLEHRLGFVAAPGAYADLAKMIKEMASLSPGERAGIASSVRLAGRTCFSKQKQDKGFIRFIAKLLGT